MVHRATVLVLLVLVRTSAVLGQPQILLLVETRSDAIRKPVVSEDSETDHMMPQNEYEEDLNKLKNSQAVFNDYENTGYDRGHLYPNSYRCRPERSVTYTLTNVAPMDACFNRIQWKIWEGYLKSFLDAFFNDIDDAEVYIITGTVPGNDKIPQSEKRVTVPSHIWTAVCYNHKDNVTKFFPFGFLGINKPEFNIKLMSVSEMNKKLDELYEQSTPSVQIFHDNCFSDKPASDNAIQEFLKRIKLPEDQRLQMSEDAQNNLFALQNIISSDNNSPSTSMPQITQLTATLTYESLSSYFKSTERNKRKIKTACVISDDKKSRRSDKCHDLWKRQVSEGSESVECQLVPEKSFDKKTAADGSPCISYTDNSYRCTCSTEGGQNKPCCSTPCLYQDSLNDYLCYSGGTQIQCSPQYSLIATAGQRCRVDHPCATYGQDYYWCYTEDKSQAYCSPPLWGSRGRDGKYCRRNHACAKYNKRYQWCYTDHDNSWNYCCTSDTYFSTISEKTCKPDSPCGYHYKNYLWCETTDGSWDYCCKEFLKQ
ncbi:uncharacterized protein LOC130417132 [Triplophysa dalaica]|uniref:uncharacterized protein LOC130417132 n=1 Tax=Triplophysa dalaica TaxID=1582913 RepID=UPI0024E02439|nr:uncharacterized protein LOC130417132 [Triplophysa dalaica]